MVRMALLGALLIAGLAVACSDDAGGALTEYDLTVGFNESVTRDDLDAANDILRSYDDGVDFLIQESFPPTGRATVETGEAAFCSRIETQLEAKSYVRDVTCSAASDKTPAGDPDGPVSSY